VCDFKGMIRRIYADTSSPLAT